MQQLNRQQLIERRRQDGEANWKARFDAFGFSECFEFVKRDWSSDKGRRVVVKCKSCSSVFQTWGFADVIKGRQDRLLCSCCGASSDGNDVWERSPKCDEAMAFYVDGHSVKETAEKFGLSTAQINNSVKVRGLSNGLRHSGFPAWLNAQRSIEAEQRLANRLESLGFEYAGGYQDKRIKIRCRQCGSEFERCLDFVRHGNVVCRKCEHEKALARKAKQRIVRKNETESKKRRAEAEKANALFHLLNDKIHICTVCGESFSITDYMKDCDLKQIQHNPKYCSDVCKRRANHRKSKECKKRSGNLDRGNHRHRARKYGVAYESGITLKMVWKRDNGICQICGKPCDWSDRGWNKYCGPLYPSIDHVIAMANGGGHVRTNVQLAHMMCNSEKGDSR